jgi:antitoxin component YwqK of YwqJK toxin-antitoxin module
MEYTLKDGKKNGVIKYFNEDGSIAKSGLMVMDLEKGIFTEFFYDKTGKLIQKEVGEMQDGKKKGKWLLNAVSNEQETNLTYTNFVNGLKEGSFSKVQNDSICFGNYKNDLLEGKYSIFTSEKDLGLVATIETDTLKLKKVLVGFFSSDKKTGLWKTYDVDGTLSLEGNYENDKKTGKWSHYYSIYVDDNDKEMDYSGKLFLEENYSNGKLNGERNRFSMLEETEFPCENDNSKKCSKIDFKKWIEKSNYENGLLDGDYELTNENNEIIEKGMFLKGKKSGKWQLLNDSKIVILNDKTIESGDFINDKKQGKWERLKNGKVVETYFYNDNFLDGEHICLSNGIAKEKRKFLKEKLTALELLDDAQKTIVKYNISESEDAYKCEKISFLADGVTIKNFVVNKESDKPIDCVHFREDFEKAQKIADGFYQKKTIDDKLLEEGNFKNDQKSGKWTTYYYDQKIKSEFEYNDIGEIKSEFYFELKKNEPFSGEFDFKYENGNGSEERKIKNGIRNGTTRYKDAKEKTIKKESYKDGVLKVKE